jgi:hypothetical protein
VKLIVLFLTPLVIKKKKENQWKWIYRAYTYSALCSGLMYSYHQKCLVQISHKSNVLYHQDSTLFKSATSLMHSVSSGNTLFQSVTSFIYSLSSDVPCSNQSQVCAQSLGSTLFKTQPGHLTEFCHGLSQSPQEHATIMALIIPQTHPFILVHCPYIRWPTVWFTDTVTVSRIK